MLSIAVVVVVVLIVPASILVKEVDVFRVLDFKALSVGDLGENFKPLGVWHVIGLHLVVWIFLKKIII